jgi:hypothetical protein
MIKRRGISSRQLFLTEGTKRLNSTITGSECLLMRRTIIIDRWITSSTKK